MLYIHQMLKYHKKLRRQENAPYAVSLTLS